jgi:DNA-directed RNA polymerase subunit M/transcription elongation factor TFIIS
VRIHQVTTPFNEDPLERLTCPKCGQEDAHVRYMSPGDNGFAQEHLLFTCDECGFEWRTLTKDAVQS